MWICMWILFFAVAEALLLPTVVIPNKNFLRPGSADTMLNREKVKAILHSRKPTFIGGRKPVGLNITELTNLHKKFYLGPKSNRTLARGGSIPDVNKAVSDYMLEGDMLLSEEHARKLTGTRSKRMVTTDDDLFWNPKITINYTIESSISSSTRKVILAAIQFWSDNSCLKFKDNVKGAHCIHFFNGDGCWSYVGQQGSWSQDISIGNGCDDLGIVTHEMSHALGFYHTQSSYDRDDYIWINYTNIQNGTQYNFEKYSQNMLTSYPKNMQYDYGSIMQYDSFAFASNYNYPTIVSLNPLYTNTMGQRFKPSFADIRMMNLMYNCTKHCNSVPPCKNFGYADPHDCTKCKCIDALSGQYCTEIAKGNSTNCNGKMVQASAEWETLDSSLGNPSDWKGSDSASWCYWAIQAPECSLLEVRLTNLKALCQKECYWQGLEINAAHVDLGGMMICCPSVLNTTFTSLTNLVTLRSYIRWNQMNFTLQYRIKPNAQQANCTVTGVDPTDITTEITDSTTSATDSVAECPCATKSTTEVPDGTDGPLRIKLILTGGPPKYNMPNEIDNSYYTVNEEEKPSNMAMG